MEHTYQYAWVIPLLPLPVIMLMGFGLFLVPTATKKKIFVAATVPALQEELQSSKQLRVFKIGDFKIPL